MQGSQNILSLFRNKLKKIWRQKVKIQLFSEYGHVAYQIKGNDACINMVADISPTEQPHHSQILGMGSKGQVNFFRTWSCCISNKMESQMHQHGSK